jgi:hypothetical protein
MPYATTTEQSNLAAWEANLTAAGLSATVTKETKWFVGATELTGAANKDAIKVNWATEGEYALKVQTNLKLGSVAACDPAEQTKKVYVLPVPTVEFTDGGGAVLACTTTEHTLKYKAAGIGVKQLKYTLTRKLYADAATTDAAADATPIGAAVTAEGEFADNVTLSTASAKYGAAALAAADEKSISLSGLAPGYVYTVTFSEISDQISHKSGVTVVPSNATAKVSFAIVPEPTNTKINHVQNIE